MQIKVSASKLFRPPTEKGIQFRCSTRARATTQLPTKAESTMGENMCNEHARKTFFGPMITYESELRTNKIKRRSEATDLEPQHPLQTPLWPATKPFELRPAPPTIGNHLCIPLEADNTHTHTKEKA
jgi:hypothetical protein